MRFLIAVYYVLPYLIAAHTPTQLYVEKKIHGYGKSSYLTERFEMQIGIFCNVMISFALAKRLILSVGNLKPLYVIFK